MGFAAPAFLAGGAQAIAPLQPNRQPRALKGFGSAGRRWPPGPDGAWVSLVVRSCPFMRRRARLGHPGYTSACVLVSGGSVTDSSVDARTLRWLQIWYPTRATGVCHCAGRFVKAGLGFGGEEVLGEVFVRGDADRDLL